MAFISVFDVLGPNMIGPSSSHTAGAARIAYIAHKMMSGELKSVRFTLYGSFAKTYHGHGTDRALLGGVLGFLPDDIRIRSSFDIAREQGIAFSFLPDFRETDVHPNTVDIFMENTGGKTLSIRGESLGGGKMRITRIDEVEVDYSGEYSAVIVIHRDRPGMVAHVSKCLGDRGVNIASMRNFREKKGSTAYSIIETDGALPEGLRADILCNRYVYDVILLQV